METLINKIIPFLFVASGGALGASLRFGVREWLPKITATQFPLSTLTVNLVGCFLAGLVYMWLEQSGTHWSSGRSLFFFMGFLGALTTFSSFALDSLLMFNQGDTFRFFLNIAANCVLSLVCVFLGAMLGGRIATH